ncbi:hypothetical protein [Mycobacterium sp.]|uniref:hypothetical protein n=1 Tax=Mycobacterium sp. TaxID=1785 RepID=UPI003D0CE8CF
MDEPCGSPASTYRVIGRVDRESQCVHDADLTLSWSAGGKSAATCLDCDWVAGQCLHIAGQSVAKVECTSRGAVQPQVAIIGAVDVSYCREGGIAHRVRHFTICNVGEHTQLILTDGSVKKYRVATVIKPTLEEGHKK